MVLLIKHHNVLVVYDEVRNANISQKRSPNLSLFPYAHSITIIIIIILHISLML
jgi:hypothetical protein